MKLTPRFVKVVKLEEDVSGSNWGVEVDWLLTFCVHAIEVEGVSLP